MKPNLPLERAAKSTLETLKGCLLKILRLCGLPSKSRQGRFSASRSDIGGLVYVRYRDHILFRNTESSLYKPVAREAVGWLVKESDEAVWLLWDRSVEKLPHERIQPRELGLVILKSDILELRRLGAQRICTSSHKTRGVEYALQKSEAKNSAAVKGKGNANR